MFWNDWKPNQQATPAAVDPDALAELQAAADAAEQINEGDEKTELEMAGTAQIANIVTIAAPV